MVGMQGMGRVAPPLFASSPIVWYTLCVEKPRGQPGWNPGPGPGRDLGAGVKAREAQGWSLSAHRVGFACFLAFGLGSVPAFGRNHVPRE